MFQEVIQNSSSSAVSIHLKTITTIIAELTSKKKDPLSRARSLQTLNSLLQRTDWSPFIVSLNAVTEVLLKDAILPSMQWQAGRATVIIRKVVITLQYVLTIQGSNILHELNDDPSVGLPRVFFGPVHVSLNTRYVAYIYSCT
jgi:hypothetical protein